MLSPKRDLTAARLFLRLALSGTHGIRPRVINVDGHPAYARAIPHETSAKYLVEGLLITSREVKCELCHMKVVGWATNDPALVHDTKLVYTRRLSSRTNPQRRFPVALRGRPSGPDAID